GVGRIAVGGRRGDRVDELKMPALRVAWPARNAARRLVHIASDNRQRFEMKLTVFIPDLFKIAVCKSP
ncbi:MAG: hypothetical protein ACN6QH_20205, partial [Pseudomonas sp.]|uniref:hypothetical protein n=1 Tax=Pseudomonas sp. TaxID=306 RepID=UPI003D1470B6